MNIDATIARIYEHLENDHVEKAVMACLRVARHTKDYVNSAIFLRELYPNKNEVIRAIYDEMASLNKDAQKYVYQHSLDRWLELHTVEGLTLDDDDSKEEGDRRNVLMIAVGELESDLVQWERAIDDLKLPPGMAEYDTAAFTDRHTVRKMEIRNRIRALATIKSRLKTRCLNYAIQMERQLALQHKSQSFLETVQNDVNNFFKARSEDVFTKLQKAAQLVSSTDAEDSALLLTEVRRALKAVADHFYPARDGEVVCGDGTARKLGDEQYLNRLQQFLAERVRRSSSKEVLEAELAHLSAFIRRVNDLASKGVHAATTFAEAKQGLIGLYFFLFNVCQHLEEKEEDAPPPQAPA